MKLSVVIPCFNGTGTLGETLAALAQQKWDHAWEVVFADNGSTDDSVALAKRWGASLPTLRVIDASARRGQPFALNTGIAAAAAESVALCDADDVPGDGWLAAMGNALAAHRFVASRIDFTRLNPPWLAASRANAQTQTLQTIQYPPYLDHAGGGTLGFRKALYEKFGGFDPKLPYLHDTDFCFRLQMGGVNLTFVPDAVMHVRMREDMRSLFRQSVHYAEYNVILAKKYRQTATPVPHPWRRFAKEWRRIVRLSLRQRRSASPLERAHFWRTLGWQLGKTKGIVAHWAAPY